MLIESSEYRSWLPVAYSDEVESKPKSVRLLNEPIVLWRDASGTCSAMRDLCIHRGTALSLGKVCESELVCPYHGWRFAADGRCTFIPQLDNPCKVPAKARVQNYLCEERFGIIWVALSAPQYPLPVVPELENSQWRSVRTGPFEWKSSAARQLENFTDLAHFPFVHPELLGDPERTLVPPHVVTREGNVLSYEIVRPEAPNTEEFPIFGNTQTQTPTRRSRYELHLPFTILLRIGWGGEEGMVYFFTSQPIADNACRGYCIVARNYNLDQEDDVIQKFEDVIFDQDKFIVESQRPEQVPFDLSEELHLKFDAVAVAYRKAMKELNYSP